MAKSHSSEFYFRRFGYGERQILLPVPRDLGLVVVIPCFNEPDLATTLESIWRCERPACSVEVILVINSAVGIEQAVLRRNLASFEAASQWFNNHPDPRLRGHALLCLDLPKKQAGVGLARKIGMDEALRRFDDVANLQGGIIANLDADCSCSDNYLVALQEHFQLHARTPGCSIYFEHPLEGDWPGEIYEAVLQYELHLRFYVQALRWAGFPFAHHTIGSAMAVRADAYRRQGGMNKRRAGEDFYFLQKIMALGGFTDLLRTQVNPSPRPSDRVPFGTGRAIRDTTSGRFLKSYPLDAFLDLRVLFQRLTGVAGRETTQAGASLLDGIAPPLREFLREEDFGTALEEILAQTTSSESFRKRFFEWLNCFRVMKYVHYARDRFYGPRPVAKEAARLLFLIDGATTVTWASASERQLLTRFRAMDRGAGAALERLD